MSWVVRFSSSDRAGWVQSADVFGIEIAGGRYYAQVFDTWEAAAAEMLHWKVGRIVDKFAELSNTEPTCLIEGVTL